MPTRNTGTAILDAQGNNATKTHLSTSIIIKVDSLVVGAIKSLAITEARSISMISEVGTDGFIDSAPQRSTEISGRVMRTRFNGRRLAAAFGRGFLHISAQRLPFDIEIMDLFTSPDANNSIITTIQNIWFDSLEITYDSDNYPIMESGGFKAERIYSQLNNGNAITNATSGNGAPILLDQFEQEADRGAFTGSIDQAGLLNAFLTDPRN